MTTTAPVALACPDCRAPLTGAPTCTACSLPLTGPDAARLWQVDVELARLDAARGALLTERRALLDRLRGGAVAPPRPGPVTAPRQEWTPQRVQNTLLVLGGALLAVAAAVFAAVSYDRLGVGGRAVVLLALTAVAATAAPRLLRRGLGATAETVAAVALALAALDAWGLRRLGLGAELADATWLAAASGALAALSTGYAAVVRLRLPRFAAPVLAHVSALTAVAAAEPTLATTSLLLTAVAALDVALLAAARLGREVEGSVVVLGALTAAGSLAAALTSGGGAATATALAALAGLAAGAAGVGSGPVRVALAACPPLLLSTAALVAAEDRVEISTLPLVGAATALALALAAALLPRAERTGPFAGVALVAVACCAAVAEHVAQALVGPAGWLVEPWTLPAGVDARAAVAPFATWDGTAVVPGVLLLAAAVAAVVGARLDRRAHVVASVVGGLAALLLPVALDLPHAAALLVLLVLAAAALAAADASAGLAADAARGGALVAGSLAAAWSTADQGTTLAVLPLVGGLLAVAAARPAAPLVRDVAAGLAAAAAGAELAAVGAAGGLAAPQVGGLLLLAVAASLAAGHLLRGVRAGLEAAAGLLAVVAVLLAAGDAGWLSWVLAGTGLLALGASLAADRRPLAPVGGLLLTASSWVRLAEAGVDAPEPYALPLAAIALVLGHLRFRRDGAVRSHSAYGPGLGLLLLPSLAATVLDDGLARPLLLGATALAVVLLGARARLQAPLLLGGGTLLVVALHLLAPYTAAVPRWTALGAVGTLLVVVGATFEQRRRDLAYVRERYESLR